MQRQRITLGGGLAVLTLALALTHLAPAVQGRAQAMSPKERLAAIRQGLMASQAKLRQYEWVETTVMIHKGEERSRQQQRCYYGLEGSLQKVPLGAAKTSDAPRGVREYMQQAAALIPMYVPLDPAKLEQAVGTGRASIHAVNPGKNVVLQFVDYLKPADAVRLSLDIATNRFLGLTIATYVETAKEPLTVDLKYGAFPDGTGYPEEITLDAPAKEVKVVVRNAGYRLVRK